MSVGVSSVKKMRKHEYRVDREKYKEIMLYKVKDGGGERVRLKVKVISGRDGNGERERERELRVFCPHICSGSLYH